jgi:hypothetical protein
MSRVDGREWMARGKAAGRIHRQRAALTAIWFGPELAARVPGLERFAVRHG